MFVLFCFISVGIYANYTPAKTCLWAAGAKLGCNNFAVCFFCSFKIQQLPLLPFLPLEQQ